VAVSLARLSEAHARQSQALAGGLAGAVWRLWAGLDDDGWWDDTEVWSVAAESEKLVSAGLQTGRRQARAYAVRALLAAGARAGRLPPVEEIYPRSGATTVEVYHRPAVQYRWESSQGRRATARESARGRLDALVRDDLAAAQRRVERDTYRACDQVIGWRRIVHPELSRGGACGLCVVASDRVYSSGDLMPLHDRCNCLPAPVTRHSDPGLRLNQDDLGELYELAGSDTAADLKRVRITAGGVVQRPAEPATQADGDDGGKKPPAGRTAAPGGDQHGRGEPRRLAYTHDGRVGRRSGASNPSPPTPEFLREAELLAPGNDPGRFFDKGGRAVAAWLERLGISSVSVRAGTTDGEKTPDGLAIGLDRTWEAKRPQSVGGLERAWRGARKQSRWMIVDGRALGLSEDDAAETLRRHLPIWGADYDEVMVIVGDHGDTYVHWKHA